MIILNNYGKNESSSKPVSQIRFNTHDDENIASDDFEPCYLGCDIIIKVYVKDTRHRKAKDIPTDILNQSNLNEATISVITQDPDDKHIGFWTEINYVREKLIGHKANLVKDDTESGH